MFQPVPGVILITVGKDLLCLQEVGWGLFGFFFRLLFLPVFLPVFGRRLNIE